MAASHLLLQKFDTSTIDPMKRVLFFACIILCHSIYGQGKVKLINLMAKRTTCDSIYIGVTNYIKIVAADAPQKSYTNIQIDSATFTLKHDTISIVPTHPHFIRITVMDGPNIMDTLTLKVKRIPSPIARFDCLGINGNSGKINKKKIIENRKVIILLEGYFYKICSICMKVQSFDIEINGKTFSIQGEMITDEAIKEIAKLKTGEKIWLRKVKCKDLVGKKRERCSLDISFTVE